MKINILGIESLGVRGLSCTVTLRDRKILIDPGIALGWHRYGYLPHPFQIAVGRQVRDRIIAELVDATDVVFSHFDGDHVPLIEPNPYQLGINVVKESMAKTRIWAKSAEPGSKLENNRRKDIEESLDRELPPAEGQNDGALSFSMLLPHGLRSKDAVTIMMTRIEEDGRVFVHASDHQFLNDESVKEILRLDPDILLSSGPPMYLRNLSKHKRQQAKQNAIRLSEQIRIMIIDHHILRDERGLEWVREISSATGNQVVCAAEFMGRTPLLLEAWRRDLYERLPVVDGWHKAYAAGEVGVDRYLQNGLDILEEIGHIEVSF